MSKVNKKVKKEIIAATADVVVTKFLAIVGDKGILLIHVAQWMYLKFKDDKNMSDVFKKAKMVNRTVKVFPEGAVRMLDQRSSKFTEEHWRVLADKLIAGTTERINCMNVASWFAHKGGKVIVNEARTQITFKTPKREVTVNLIEGYPDCSPELLKLLSSFAPDVSFNLVKTNVAVIMITKILVAVIDVRKGTKEALLYKSPNEVLQVFGKMDRAVQILKRDRHWTTEAQILLGKLVRTTVNNHQGNTLLKYFIGNLHKKYESATFYNYVHDWINLNMAKDPDSCKKFVRDFARVFAVPKVPVMLEAQKKNVKEQGSKYPLIYLAASRKIRGTETKGGDASKNVHLTPCLPNGYSTANKGAAIAKYVSHLKLPVQRFSVYGVPPGHMVPAMKHYLGSHPDADLKFYDIKQDEGHYPFKWKVADLFNGPFITRSTKQLCLISDAWGKDSFTKKLPKFLGFLEGAYVTKDGKIGANVKEGFKDPLPIHKHDKKTDKVFCNGYLEKVHYFIKINLPIPSKLSDVPKKYVPDLLNDILKLVPKFHAYSHSRPHNLEFYISNVSPNEADLFFDFVFGDITIMNVHVFVSKLCQRSLEANVCRNFFMMGSDYTRPFINHLVPEIVPDLTRREPVKKKVTNDLDIEIDDDEIGDEVPNRILGGLSNFEIVPSKIDDISESGETEEESSSSSSEEEEKPKKKKSNKGKAKIKPQTSKKKKSKVKSSKSKKKTPTPSASSESSSESESADDGDFVVLPSDMGSKSTKKKKEDDDTHISGHFDSDGSE